MRTAFKTLVLASLIPLMAACSGMKEPAPAPEAPAAFVPPTKEQMEAAFKKASTLTSEHALLKDLAGEWKATTKMWMDPQGNPEVSTGRSTKTMTLGGKFLKEDFSGKFMNTQFKGSGLTGFDTVTGEFNSLWIDSMSTAMMTSTGTLDKNAKTIALGGSMSCPMADGKIPVRSVLHLGDKNHHSFEMFMAGPDGKEVKTFEVAYVRVK